MKFRMAWFIWLLFLFPLGCGDNGNTQEGVFVDSPVEGLGFASDTQSGTTDGSGTFLFAPGESIRFFLGDTTLGEGLGEDLMSPFNLVPGANPVTSARDIRKLYNDFNKNAVVGFEVVTNIAFLLQTIDDDGDPTNGLLIPESVDAFLAGGQINFSRKMNYFTEDVVFQGLRNQGFNQGLWGGGRPLPSLGRVLNHLYETLELVPEIYRPKIYRHDQDNDGMVDQVLEFGYDAAGRLSQFQIDQDNDGMIDDVERIFFNDFDQLVRVEIDEGNDGALENVITIQYDERGNEIRSENDMGNDGTADSIIISEYNELNQLIRETQDGDGNGVPDSIDSFFYDSNGNIIRIEEDDNGDGTSDNILTKTYDERGNLLTEESDLGNNGTIDSRSSNQYSENNLKTRTEIDSDANGTADQIDTFIYDNNNNLIRHDVDGDGNGTVDQAEITQYDELGNVTRYEYDSNNDGVPESIDIYHYDENGYMSLIENDSDGDGTPDEVTTGESELTNSWYSFFGSFGA